MSDITKVILDLPVDLFKVDVHQTFNLLDDHRLKKKNVSLLLSLFPFVFSVLEKNKEDTLLS